MWRLLSAQQLCWRGLTYEVRVDVAGLVVPAEEGQQHVAGAVANAVAAADVVVVLRADRQLNIPPD